MFRTTIKRLKCPSCANTNATEGGTLELSSHTPPFSNNPIEVSSGYLVCKKCGAKFLILAGVALLVEDTYDYLMTHVKGISQIVPNHEIPDEFRDDFVEAKAELQTEHIDDDLEAERVNALYLMNHYLKADSKLEWWKPLVGTGSPLIDNLIREHWDRGPFSQIKNLVSELAHKRRFKAALELGCGVGGLCSVLRPHCDFYLGVDSSFASIALARHLALGAPYPRRLLVPEDLIQGAVSREIKIPAATSPNGLTGSESADFVVTDFQNPAIAKGWDLTLSLNMIDMLDEPELLPLLQYNLLEKNGVAIQSCPYIWHEVAATHLRAKLPMALHGDSARAVEWLYREAGFEIEKSLDHIPWLFFKHVRQLEIYSVHMFIGRAT